MKFLKSDRGGPHMPGSGHWLKFYGLFLTAFTAYVLLDTFVIPRSYASAADTAVAAETAVAQTSADTAISEAVKKATAKRTAGQTGTAAAATAASAAASASGEQTQQAAVTSTASYTDSGTTVTLTTYRENDTDIHVADIVLSSAEQLKTALANSTYGKNITEKTSAMAAENNAVLAINGDYYGAQNAGYVIRNGTLYRSKSSGADTEDLVIYSDGTFEIIREGDITAEELLNKGALQVFSFGPGLVQDGTVTVTDGTEVDRAMRSNPRTAVGQIGSLHYVFVVADGRTDESSGLSVKELADFMSGTLGCRTAYNLDGGGSSTMYFNGTVVNSPTTNGRISERSVSDIVYIGKN